MGASLSHGRPPVPGAAALSEARRSGERPGVLDPCDALPAARRRLRAWLALQRRGALRPVEARAALEAHGEPEAALRRLCGERPEDVLPERDFERDLASLARLGVRLLPYGSPGYPRRVAVLADASPLLGVRGDPAALGGVFAAIVGARGATSYGLGVARRLARDLAEEGIGVVSGLARGIDAAAHRGALDAGGCTVGVLGCGPDRVYPRGHAGLADEIAARRGALLSELPPGAPPLAMHVPLRNRLISALAEAVVVVEARARSGSLITVEHAAEQGREVLAVPGPVDSPESEGPNRLLRDGAAPALDASDVLRAIGREPRRAPRARPPSEPREPEARELWLALRAQPATRDELAARLGLAPQELARRLLPLELDGRILEDRDGRLRVVSG